MGNNGTDNIEILPAQMSTPQIIQYEPIKYGDPIVFAVPGTSLIAREAIHSGISNALEWDAITSLFNGNDFAFRIVPINSTKKIGDILSYDDQFAIQYATGSFVVVNPTYGYLELVYQSLDKILKDKVYATTFTFTSKMTGYYCDSGGTCQSIPMKDANSTKGVSRNPGCWGMCTDGGALQSITTEKVRKWFPLLVIILIVIVGSILLGKIIRGIIIAIIIVVIFILLRRRYLT
jgi:hypothetical protein